MSEFIIEKKLMGTAFKLIINHKDEIQAKILLQDGVDEIIRIEALLSEFIPNSVTSLINRNAGRKSVSVPAEVYQLLLRCIKLSELSQGAFDITVKPLKKLYNFKGTAIQFPEKLEIENALKKTGFSNIDLSRKNKVYLMKEGMAIGFASIGKGYAADRVKDIWLKRKVESGVINASGDLCVIGSKTSDAPWKVGIADPVSPDKTLLYIPLSNGAIATSGDYEQYFMFKGERYAHTIDPTSGLPVRGVKSVSLVSVSSELADALATAVYVLGVKVGLHLVQQLPGTHCIIIDSKNKLHFSKNIKFEYSK